MIAYKIMTAAEHGALRTAGVFDGSAVDVADGFIHLSGADQVDETLGRHFAGQSGLVIAAIDLDRLGPAVRWEASRGGALFPHVYGSVPLSAVLAASDVVRDAAGALILPG